VNALPILAGGQGRDPGEQPARPANYERKNTAHFRTSPHTAFNTPFRPAVQPRGI
jgi:hypothetical protein